MTKPTIKRSSTRLQNSMVSSISGADSLCYIYALCDPDTFRIRYIGKSKDPENRLKLHLLDKSISHKTKWINKLKRINKSPILKILQEVNSEEWEFYERYWICELKAAGVKLTNGTIGGAGTLGYKWRPDQIKKITDNIEVIEKRLAAQRITTSTKEYSEKMKRLAKERYSDPDFKNKHLEALNSEEYKAKRKKLYDNQEYKDKIKIAQKQAMNTPECKAKLSAIQKRVAANPEFKAKQIAARNTPEYKAMMSEAQKLRYRKAKELRGNVND